MKRPPTDMIESLEARRLFCAAPGAVVTSAIASHVTLAAGEAGDVTPPTLVSVQIQGAPRSTTGVVLTFSEALDPVRAQRVSNYQISRSRTRCEIDPLPDPDPHHDIICGDERQTIKIDGAIYDDAAHTVTLLPREAFDATVRMRRIRISADEDQGVADAAGNRLDGNENGVAGGRGVFLMRFKEGRSVSYREADGDRVKLRVQGPGRVSVLRRLDDDGEKPLGDPQALLSGGPTAETVLAGTVTPGKKGDGIGRLTAVSNVNGASIAIADDPAFAIGKVES
jgi:hypothetical protein